MEMVLEGAPYGCWSQMEPVSLVTLGGIVAGWPLNPAVGGCSVYQVIKVQSLNVYRPCAPPLMCLGVCAACVVVRRCAQGGAG